MANKYFKAFLFLAFLIIAENLVAQAPPPPDPDDLPIDGGVIGLLVLGAGYAVKKIRDNSKE